MAQRLARLARPLLVVVALLHLAAPGPTRAFLYHQFYPVRSADERTLQSSPAQLSALGYLEDPPDDLSAFATFAKQTATDGHDGRQLIQITQRLYDLRKPDSRVIAGGRDRGVTTIFERLRDGESGLCGHMTLVVAAMWRSLGGHFREIRFSPDSHQEWAAGHYALEVYSTAEQRWFFFDVNANAFAVDANGTALSLSDINRQLRAGRPVQLITADGYRPWTRDNLLSYLQRTPSDAESIALDNRLMLFEHDRRFGPLNFAAQFITGLPRPMDRFFDAITTSRTPRLISTDATGPR